MLAIVALVPILPVSVGPRGGARGFAAKFYDILTDESSDIVTWTKSGQAFQVVDYARFSDEILLKVRGMFVPHVLIKNTSEHLAWRQRAA